MNQDVERARRELDLARKESTRLQQEFVALLKTLDPARGVACTAEMDLGKEGAAWIDRLRAAEHALFRAEHGTPGIVGASGDYHWLTSVDHKITDLLRLCPDVVLHRYLAVTSIDSGALHLTEEERHRGWWTAEEGRIFRGLPDGAREDRDDWRIAYSPCLDSIHGLPNETHEECCSGFDEWYVFERAIPVGDIETFVNWGLRLYDPSWKWLIDRYWEQIARLAPESYIAEGAVFTFATRNAALFTSVLTGFSEPRSQR